MERKQSPSGQGSSTRSIWERRTWIMTPGIRTLAWRRCVRRVMAAMTTPGTKGSAGWR
jgi:hypothetical protein